MSNIITFFLQDFEALTYKTLFDFFEWGNADKNKEIYRKTFEENHRLAKERVNLKVGDKIRLNYPPGTSFSWTNGEYYIRDIDGSTLKISISLDEDITDCYSCIGILNSYMEIV